MHRDSLVWIVIPIAFALGCAKTREAPPKPAAPPAPIRNVADTPQCGVASRINSKLICAGQPQPAAPVYDPSREAIHPIAVPDWWGRRDRGRGRRIAAAKGWTLPDARAVCESELVLCFDVTATVKTDCFYSGGGVLRAPKGFYRVVEAHTARVILEGAFRPELDCPPSWTFSDDPGAMELGGPLEDPKVMDEIEKVVDTRARGR